MNMEQTYTNTSHLKKHHNNNNEKCNETITDSVQCDKTPKEKVEIEIDLNMFYYNDTTVVYNRDQQNTYEWNQSQIKNPGLTNNYATQTTEANNNSFETDYFDNIMNLSQMTSDASLNNLRLDNFTPEVETECLDRELVGSFSAEIIKENEIDNLDDFETCRLENIEDVLDYFKIVNACNSTEQQDEKTTNVTYTNNSIETARNSYNISKHPSILDDVISISSDNEITILDLDANFNSFRETNVVNHFNNTEDNHRDTSAKEVVNGELNNSPTQVIDEDSCDSYHSSDFEFITEEEAGSDLLSYNRNATGTFNITEMTQDSGFNDSGCSSQNSAGPSNRNNWRNINDYSEAIARYENYNFNILREENRRNHEVPDGDRYLELFREEFAPIVPFTMENKSTRPSSAYVQYEGIGFDMRAARMSSDSDDEYADEAKESAKIILCMYPDENKRKRKF